MSERMNRRRRKKKLNVFKVLGLFSFIILVGLGSYLLIQSKFQAEANAAPPKNTVEQHLNDGAKGHIDDKNKSKAKDDNLDQEKLKKPDSKVDKETSEKDSKKTDSVTDTNKENSQDNEKTKDSDKVTDKNPPINKTEPPVTTSKTVYLTFDDGPAKVSGDILALLKKYNAKATFFMIDGNIKMYPDAAKQMVEEGHSVGSHSVTHDAKKFYKSADSVVGEMSQTLGTIKSTAGVDSVLIRTPYGSSPYMTPTYRKAIDSKGYKMWDWNIDSRDWDYKDARYVDSVIEQLNQLKTSTQPLVILMHERPQTAAHLERLLDYLSKQGYEMKAINASMEPVQFKH